MIKLLLAFFISISAQAAQPGAVPSVTVAATGANTASVSISPVQLVIGCAGSGSSGCFSLFGGGITATGGNFYPLIGGPGGAGTYSSPGSLYRVTTGKTAYCFDMTAGSNFTSPLSYQLASGTATTAAAGAGSLTGPVYQCGATAAYCQQTGGTTSVPAVVPGTYQFGAQTWPAYQTASGSQVYNIHIDCFEQ